MPVRAISKDEAEMGMSDKFKALGGKAYIDANKAQAPKAAASSSGAEHAAKNAALVKESNRAF